MKSFMAFLFLNNNHALKSQINLNKVFYLNFYTIQDQIDISYFTIFNIYILLLHNHKNLIQMYILLLNGE